MSGPLQDLRLGALWLLEFQASACCGVRILVLRCWREFVPWQAVKFVPGFLHIIWVSCPNTLRLACVRLQLEAVLVIAAFLHMAITALCIAWRGVSCVLCGDVVTCCWLVIWRRRIVEVFHVCWRFVEKRYMCVKEDMFGSWCYGAL